MYSVIPGKSIIVKVFNGHWFRICKSDDENDTFFRINPTSFLGSLRTPGSTSHPTVFDLNTNITLSYNDYRGWQYYNSSSILNTQHLNTERPEVIRRNNSTPQEEEEDAADDARLMLAIQLSLEQTSSLTSDATDYNIGNLFSGIY